MNTSSAEFLATKANKDTATPTPVAAPEIIGAEMLVRALHAEGVEFVWGYPGGSVLLSMTKFLSRISLNTYLFATSKQQCMRPMVTHVQLVRLALP